MHLLLTATQIQHLEDQVQTLVQVLSYAAPLLAGLFVLYAATYRYVMNAIKANQVTLKQIEQNTNGKMTEMARHIQEVRDATIDAQSRGSGPAAPSD